MQLTVQTIRISHLRNFSRHITKVSIALFHLSTRHAFSPGPYLAKRFGRVERVLLIFCVDPLFIEKLHIRINVWDDVHMMAWKTSLTENLNFISVAVCSPKPPLWIADAEISEGSSVCGHRPFCVAAAQHGRCTLDHKGLPVYEHGTGYVVRHLCDLPVAEYHHVFNATRSPLVAQHGSCTG